MATLANGVPFRDTDALNVERLAHASGHSAVANPWVSMVHGTPQNDTELIDYIPGEPTVPLTNSGIFLRKELTTPTLDELFNKLWLVAKKSGSNIDALHRQIIKSRDIMPTEDPRLHLVWQEKRIFVKPIPLCLLNHDFWTRFLSNSNTTSRLSSTSNSYTADQQSSAPGSYRAVALGFLRSYAFLIQHRSDLRLAKEHYLIPEGVEWDKWSKFIAGFRDLSDKDVAKRYWYGQLRLTRLNWATRIWRPKSNKGNKGRAAYWFYEEPDWSTLPYIREAAVPLAFIFASVSLILSSMQVMLAVPSDSLSSKGVGEGGLEAMQLTSWGFSIVTLVFSGVSLTLLAFIPLIVLLGQLSWAIRHTRGEEVTGEFPEAAQGLNPR
ncbi:hypothetical protein DL765_010879 [Monosporascus sp. GIB2]|nr:hypothetical protein DL765_010879 [Monosporascus sp. GIB2]